MANTYYVTTFLKWKGCCRNYFNAFLDKDVRCLIKVYDTFIYRISNLDNYHTELGLYKSERYVLEYTKLTLLLWLGQGRA